MSGSVFNMRSAKWGYLTVLLVLFIVVRIINLDSDLPPFVLMNYSAIDEFYYSLSSFNLFHYGCFINPTIPLADRDATALALLINLFQFITLEVFGNNYFGLRLGSGLCSLVLFLIIIDSIRRTSLLWNNTLNNFENKNSYLAVIILLCFFAIDYTFLSASRVSEPGISRSLILVILIWFMIANEKMESVKPMLYYFLLGFIALFSVCCVYLYNIYYVGAVGLAIVLINIKNKNSVKSIVLNCTFFAIGGIVCCLLYEGFINLFFGKSFLDYMGTITHVSDVRVSSGSKGLVGSLMIIKKMLLANFGTSMFNLNLSFLLINLLMFPVYLYRTIKRKNNVDIFICCLFLFWLAQSYFENSYPLKRHTVMFPVFFLVLVYSLEEITEMALYLKKHFLSKIIYFIYVVLVLVVIWEISNNFIKTYAADFPELIIFEKINIVCCIGLLIFGAIFLWKKNPNIKLIYLSALFLIVPSVYLFVNKIVFNATYKYKNAMIDVGSHVGNNIMVGGVSYGFRLYNSSRPALNLYMYQYHDRPELKKRIIKLFETSEYCMMIPNRKLENDILKLSPMELGYLKEISTTTSYSFELVKVYDIGERNVLLIKKKDETL